jgi:Proteasome assembly chaperone 4
MTNARIQRFNPSQPLSTPLCTVEPTFELTTRLAKLLAKKTRLPVYVGNSMSFASAGLGGTMEEEMEAFKQVAGLVLSKLQHIINPAGTAPNGDGP